MSFQDLYQRCRSEFLVNSDLTLKAQVQERDAVGVWIDHGLIENDTTC